MKDLTDRIYLINDTDLVSQRDDLFVATTIHPESSVATDRDYANARRIESCWNIMDGIPLERFQGKTLFQYVTGEAFIANMLPTAEGVSLGLTGLATQMLAASFAGQFKGTGATNFLEVGMHHHEIGEFTVTIQRHEGETPAQLKADAEAKCAKLLAMLERVIDAEFGFGERGSWPTEGELRNLVVEVSKEGAL